MKIALLGQFGSGNSGNDASLEAAVTFLRKRLPAAELVCICSEPNVVENTILVLAIGIGAPPFEHLWMQRFDHALAHLPHRIASLWTALRGTRGLDWLIIPGTGILDDFQDGPFNWPYVLLRWCLAARLAGARIAFVSVGAGPIHHPLSRRFMKLAARLATYRSYRDPGSKAYMRSIGFDPEDDPLRPDLAFSLPAPQARQSHGERLTVGIGVMDYHGWVKGDRHGDQIYSAYLNKIGAFTCWLLRQGHVVRLIGGDDRDSRAIADIEMIIGSELTPEECGRLAVGRSHTLRDIMAEMVDIDLVVATRFHNVVCALKLGLPTISLGYAEKNGELLDRFGLGNFALSIETFDGEILKQRFSELAGHRTQYTSLITGRIVVLKTELAEQEAALVTLFTGISSVDLVARGSVDQARVDCDTARDSNTFRNR